MTKSMTERPAWQAPKAVPQILFRRDAETGRSIAGFAEYGHEYAGDPESKDDSEVGAGRAAADA